MAIAEEVITFIQDRSASGLDKRNRPFKRYTDKYAAKKGQDEVDLVLTGDMLDELTILEETVGKIVIGYEEDSDQNAKAEGNIIGSYGQPTGDKKKARDFLGITKADLMEIISKVREDEEGE